MALRYSVSSGVQAEGPATLEVGSGVATSEAPEQADELLTKKQVCEYLNVTPTTIWRWHKQGKIETYGIGKIRYYKKAEITNLLTKLKK
jgi:excisionase family DNA binding protein